MERFKVVLGDLGRVDVRLYVRGCSFMGTFAVQVDAVAGRTRYGEVFREVEQRLWDDYRQRGVFRGLFTMEGSRVNLEDRVVSSCCFMAGLGELFGMRLT
jgi:hypothetical protein